MNMIKSQFALALAVFSGFCATEAPQPDSLPAKKFIELGWDIPDTAFMRTNWSEMEKNTPFDGVMFQIKVKGDDQKVRSTQNCWNAEAWKREWLKPAIEDLKACGFKRMVHNFARFNATPGSLDWADDAGWAALSEKAGFCAWAVKQGGGRGLAPDWESYGEKQFRYNPAKGKTFLETASLARKRGAQFMGAIAREFPDAVILALWLDSINIKAGQNDEPEAILAGGEYGLLPAFINGMLDAAPPSIVLVDGCENGYYMDSAEAYLDAANQMRSWSGAAARLIAPENRAKYRQQVQAGFGFYLDMFLNEEGNRYYFPPLDGSRLKRLERNLGYALAAADEYVWIYGEQSRWWGAPLNLPKTVGKGRLWEEAMPGITRAIRWIRDPIGAARAELEELRQLNRLTNLAVNPQFSEGPVDKAKLPPGYTAWQDEKNPTGTFGWDSTIGGGAAKAVRVKWGCFLQSHPVEPGQRYAVQAECLAQGSTAPNLMIRWQTPEGKWTKWHEDQTFVFKNGPGQWRTAFGVVTVPQGVGRLLILLNVNGQLTDKDVCWFDNVALYRLP